MRTIVLTWLFILCTTFLFASQNRKVLIIGIDGTRSDAFVQANTPNIDGLLGNATFSYDSWHTGITISGPSWSTILTGVNWNKHGIIDNNFTAPNFIQYPPLPTLAKQIKPNLNCAIVAEWDPLIDDITNANWNRKVKAADGKTFPTADSAIIELQNPDLDLLFTYFDHVDLTGHSTQFTPTNALYISAIQQVDTAVGEILTALHARPTYASEDWLILVITDHGGNGYLHGFNTDAERHIWWIASGSMVAAQQINKADPGTYNCNTYTVFDASCVDATLLKQSPVQADITVTALHYLIYDSGINPETDPVWDLDGKSWLVNTTSTNDFEADKGVIVHPNPSSGTFTITGLPLTSGESMAVEIFSADGRKVFSTTATETNMVIDISKLQKGFYLLQAGIVIKKVVLN